jgi:outer membrane protein assembly factor BamB
MSERRNLIPWLLPGLAAVAAAAGLTLWLQSGRTDLQQRLPGADEQAEAVPLGEDTGFVDGGEHRTFDEPVPDMLGAWPRFRGASSDGICRTAGGAATGWRPPRELWSLEVGEGYAGASILDGRVFLLDYDRRAKRDVVRCLSLATGRDIWSYSYPAKLKRDHGMSRTVPAVTAQHVVTVGPKCHVHCLDTTTGAFRWAIDMVGRYGTRVPPWYTGQCPLIEDGKAILAPAGTALLVAVDLDTGEVVWETPNPHGWTMTHTSVTPIDFGDTRMLLYTGSGGIVAVSPDDGAVLWEFTGWKVPTANVPSPVFLPPDTLLLTGGYGAGSIVLRLTETESGFSVAEHRRMKPEHYGAHQHTPVPYEGYIYGLGEDGQLTCLDRDGDVVWKSGSDVTFGKAAYLLVDGVVLAFDNDGLLRAARATPERFELLGETKVLDGPDAWGPMACASGTLVVRDLAEMKALDLGGVAR